MLGFFVEEEAIIHGQLMYKNDELLDKTMSVQLHQKELTQVISFQVIRTST